MRRFLCSLVAGVFFAAFAGGITPAPASPPSGTIPLDTDGGSSPFVRGRVQGTPFWFLLDTASPSSFGRKQAQRLGLPDGPTLGEVAIDLPGVTVTMASLAVADLDARQIALGHRLDGVLGSEFFARFVVTLDFQAGTLTLRDAKNSRFRGKGPILPLEIEGGRPYIELQLRCRRQI